MSRYVTRGFVAKVQSLIDASIETAKQAAKDYALSRVVSARADLQMYVDVNIDEAKAAGKAYADSKDAAVRNEAYDYTDEQLAAEVAGLLGMDVATPTTGGTVSLNKRLTILAPASGLAALTLALPAGFHNQRRRVAATRAITALTFSSASGETVVEQAPSSMAAGSFFELCFISGAAKTWVRIG